RRGDASRVEERAERGHGVTVGAVLARLVVPAHRLAPPERRERRERLGLGGGGEREAVVIAREEAARGPERAPPIEPEGGEGARLGEREQRALSDPRAPREVGEGGIGRRRALDPLALALAEAFDVPQPHADGV